MAKYLKGFNNFGVRSVTTNTNSTYLADDTSYLAVPGAQSCSPTDNRTNFNIRADDGVWDSGADWETTNLEITVVEAELSTIAFILGVALTDGVLSESNTDEAPELALTFSALRADGGYRLYRYYSAKCTGYRVSHTTKGQNNDAQSYTLTFECTPRKSDGVVRDTKDIAKGTALTWLTAFNTTTSSNP